VTFRGTGTGDFIADGAARPPNPGQTAACSLAPLVRRMPTVTTIVPPVTRTGVITVASVPANHVYVRHLTSPDGDDGIRRLADPRPCGAPSDQSVWWPPVMLDPEWIECHYAEFDVFHVHFGFDSVEPAVAAEPLAVMMSRPPTRPTAAPSRAACIGSLPSAT